MVPDTSLTGVPDTSPTPPKLASPSPTARGGGHEPEGDDDGRAEAGGPPRAGAHRRLRGRGVPPARDLKRDLLRVPAPLRGRRGRGPRTQAQASGPLSSTDRRRPGGGDLWDAQRPPQVGRSQD